MKKDALRKVVKIRQRFHDIGPRNTILGEWTRREEFKIKIIFKVFHLKNGKYSPYQIHG